MNAAAIDFAHLDRYACGDAALRDEILALFVEQARLAMSRLDAGMGDEAWSDALHRLKGSARGVGAWRVGALCERGEALTGCGGATTAARRALLKSLAAEVEAALAEARSVTAVG
ncbi:Hpt domain-containing protein [Amphiplicatus metriothermophilus]|uniref:Hpt domain-containing protein n=1 Tax=Amphiplicatus metriothermophilus TaxID=1519374 RepID=A0A239PV29_9PROT|nr:Hpt domain-containing protein [Amphiplicatus metriothermophilus]MBB5519396.1 HPt (histidine-containing phosphotransfer) domain-containing protein [Amphiplicatus metriothermophilus]SNT73537.1 Hpt domain-containing protein [Amphiplicatus metriothermophilus]